MTFQIGDKVRRKPKRPPKSTWAKGAYRPVGEVIELNGSMAKVRFKPIQLHWYATPSQWPYKWTEMADLELVESAKSADDSLGTVNSPT